MNTEELKMIVDMLSSLGANGKEAFIWWLVAQYGLSFINDVAFFACFAFAVVKVAIVVSKYYENARHGSGVAMNAEEELFEAARRLWLYHESQTTQGLAFKIYGMLEEARKERGNVK